MVSVEIELLKDTVRSVSILLDPKRLVKISKTGQEPSKLAIMIEDASELEEILSVFLELNDKLIESLGG